MPKKAQAVKKDVKKLEVASEVQVSAGRYANHIQVVVQEEEFVLDFFARTGEGGIHVARVFISPTHAERLMNLLKRQTAQHKRAFPHSALRKTRAKGTARRKG
jgi:hypothetical protein